MELSQQSDSSVATAELIRHFAQEKAKKEGRVLAEAIPAAVVTVPQDRKASLVIHQQRTIASTGTSPDSVQILPNYPNDENMRQAVAHNASFDTKTPLLPSTTNNDDSSEDSPIVVRRKPATRPQLDDDESSMESAPHPPAVVVTLPKSSNDNASVLPNELHQEEEPEVSSVDTVELKRELRKGFGMPDEDQEDFALPDPADSSSSSDEEEEDSKPAPVQRYKDIKPARGHSVPTRHEISAVQAIEPTFEDDWEEPVAFPDEDEEHDEVQVLEPMVRQGLRQASQHTPSKLSPWTAATEQEDDLSSVEDSPLGVRAEQAWEQNRRLSLPRTRNRHSVLAPVDSPPAPKPKRRKSGWGRGWGGFRRRSGGVRGRGRGGTSSGGRGGGRGRGRGARTRPSYQSGTLRVRNDPSLAHVGGARIKFEK